IVLLGTSNVRSVSPETKLRIANGPAASFVKIWELRFRNAMTPADLAHCQLLTTSPVLTFQTTTRPSFAPPANNFPDGSNVRDSTPLVLPSKRRSGLSCP